MRPEVISEAINNISEEYKLEALELHDQARVSEITNMKRGISKRLVGVGIAASFALALGITAYATGFFGIKQRDADPGETVTVEFNLEDENGFTAPEVVTYDQVSKIVTFEGPMSCNKVEFLSAYLPAGYIDDGIFGDPSAWGSDHVQFFDSEYNVYNIELYYTAQFGPDGFMFFEDEFSSVEETQIGEYYALKMVGHVEGDIEIPDGIESDDVYYSYDNCYIILLHPDGYIFFLSGENMSELESIAQGLTVRAAEGVVEYDANADHHYYMLNGVG